MITAIACYLKILRYFDTRPHGIRSRQTSISQALPPMSGQSESETPLTVPPLPNQDGRELLEQGGA